jgi:two-component system, NtrC family, response regulator
MRTSPRVSVNYPFTLFGSSLIGDGITSDLGLGGAFLKLPVIPKQNSLVNLKFHPVPKMGVVELLGRVAHTNSEGIGVEFLDLDSELRSHIWNLVIIPLVRTLINCPFCGKTLPNAVRRCPNCRKSLDFEKKDFLESLKLPDQDEEMIGTCPAIRELFQMIRKVAPSDVAVLVTGASGTGKELVARAIHERSLRADGPFVPINCGAIPRELLESELFGHEKGAFSGAYRTTIGTVERAHGGTLFLDEVGELPLELQVKLLRFLQDYSFTRVGGRAPIQVDLRIISATNGDLEDLTQNSQFREDLYYRLNVIHLHLPLLKDRDMDSLIMANIFLKRYARKVGKEFCGFTRKAVGVIQGYPWPGNIRELVNRIRRGVVLAEGSWIGPDHLGLALEELEPEPIFNGRGLKEAKAEFEARLVAEVLSNYQGNAQMASKALKISRSMLYHLVQKYDLKGQLALNDNHGVKELKKVVNFNLSC